MESRKLYASRLALIDEVNKLDSSRGPSQQNISSGQAEFLGVVREGKYVNNFMLVFVEGIPTNEQARELGVRWWDASSEEIWSQVTGFDVTRLRTYDNPAPRWASQISFSLPTFAALCDFLDPMDIEWKSAVETLAYIESEGWSPDWGGDE